MFSLIPIYLLQMCLFWHFSQTGPSSHSRTTTTQYLWWHRKSVGKPEMFCALS